MNPDRLRDLLESVRRGEVDPDAALEQLARLPFVDVPGARVDTHSSLRTGLPEVVYAPGKTPQQIADIATALRGAGQSVLVTRLEAEPAEQVGRRLGAGEYDPVARTLWLGPAEVATVGKGTIAIICAGTADLPVAQEALRVARYFGNKVELLVDVGVAGLHRLLAASEVLRSARVLIVIAGWRARCPRWSRLRQARDRRSDQRGYGVVRRCHRAARMLTSCASNVTVVNIDNGSARPCRDVINWLCRASAAA
jgi:NCAIR mutase (PurE)-related protein